jgi:hypothetical protein
MVFDVFDDSRNIITGKLGNESKDLRARPNVLTILGLPLAPCAASIIGHSMLSTDRSPGWL